MRISDWSSDVCSSDLTSGTDVRLTLGNIAVSLNAANDQAFSPEGDLGTDVAGGGATVDIGGSGGSVDLGGGSDLGGWSVEGPSGGDVSLPDVPEAGGEAPPPSERPFAAAVHTRGWGMDGGSLPPSALPDLGMPLLFNARTFAPP